MYLVLDRAYGHMRPVIHDGDVNGPVGDPVNAQVNQKMVSRRPVIHREILQLFFNPPLVETAYRQAYAEGIAAHPAAYALLRQVFRNPGGYPLKGKIPERVAVNIVDHLEIADIRVHNREFFIRITVQEFFCALVQIVPVEHSGQLIVPGIVQLPLHLPLLVRIVPHADVESVHPLMVVDQRPLGQLADMLSVFRFQDHLVAPAFLTGMPVPELSVQLASGLVRFFFLQTKQFLSGAVHPEAFLIGVKKVDRIPLF